MHTAAKQAKQKKQTDGGNTFIEEIKINKAFGTKSTTNLATMFNKNAIHAPEKKQKRYYDR